MWLYSGWFDDSKTIPDNSDRFGYLRGAGLCAGVRLAQSHVLDGRGRFNLRGDVLMIENKNRKLRISEHDITISIRNLLKTFNIFHWKNHGGPMGARGVPDILGIYQGRLLGIEIKTATGKPSPEQERFIQNINAAGGLAFVARSVEDVIEKLGLQKRLLF